MIQIHRVRIFSLFLTFLLAISAKLPAKGLQSRELILVSPPIIPIITAPAPRLPEKPVIGGVTSMGLEK